MPHSSTLRTLTLAAALVAAALVPALPLRAAQGGRQGTPPPSEHIQQAVALMKDGKTADALAAVRRELESDPTSNRAATMLDTLGATVEARVVFQRIIDAAADPAAKAAAQRAMAMSFAFDGDCASTVKYEQMVIAYWVTREQAEPQNAFYQQGEMANEAARVCLDAGDVAAAEQWYRTGTESGLKEPGPQTHPKSLWQFRLAHALGRVWRRAAATRPRRSGRSRPPGHCSTAIRRWPRSRSASSRIWWDTSRFTPTT